MFGFIPQSLAMIELIVKGGLLSYFHLLGLRDSGFGFYNYYEPY